MLPRSRKRLKGHSMRQISLKFYNVIMMRAFVAYPQQLMHPRQHCPLSRASSSGPPQLY